MAVAYRSGSVQSYNSGSGTTSSVVINAPVGVSAGDYIVCAITTTGSPTITPPSGWFLRSTIINLGSGTAQRALYYKPNVSGSEPSTYTFSLSSTERAVAEIASFTGTDPYFPNAGGSASTTGVTGTTTGNFLLAPQTDLAYEYTSIGDYNSTTTPITVSSHLTNQTTLGDATTNTTTPYVHINLASGPAPNSRLDGPNAGTATMSASVTSGIIQSALRAATAGQTVPLMTFRTLGNVNNTNSNTTSSLNVPITGKLYVVISVEDNTSTISSVTATGFTFTQLATVRGSGSGLVEMWVTDVVAFDTPTVVVSFSANVYSHIEYFQFSGSSGIGAISTASGSSTTASASLTTTGRNSLVVSLYGFNSYSGSFTPSGTMTTLVSTLTSNVTYLTQVSKNSSLTASSGTSVTHTVTASVSHPWSGVVFEILQSGGTRTHTTDSLLRSRYTKTHTTNSFLAANVKKNHLTNSLLRLRTTRTHTTNGLLAKRFLKTHTTSAFKRLRGLRTHLTDANKRKVTLRTFTTDSRLAKRSTKSHSTDASLAPTRFYKEMPHAAMQKLTLEGNTTQIKPTAEAVAIKPPRPGTSGDQPPAPGRIIRTPRLQ